MRRTRRFRLQVPSRDRYATPMTFMKIDEWNIVMNRSPRSQTSSRFQAIIAPALCCFSSLDFCKFACVGRIKPSRDGDKVSPEEHRFCSNAYPTSHVDTEVTEQSWLWSLAIMKPPRSARPPRPAALRVHSARVLSLPCCSWVAKLQGTSCWSLHIGRRSMLRHAKSQWETSGWSVAGGVTSDDSPTRAGKAVAC